MIEALAAMSPELRAAILKAYRSWKAKEQQLSLFDEVEELPGA